MSAATKTTKGSAEEFLGKAEELALANLESAIQTVADAQKAIDDLRAKFAFLPAVATALAAHDKMNGQASANGGGIVDNGAPKAKGKPGRKPGKAAKTTKGKAGGKNATTEEIVAAATVAAKEEKQFGKAHIAECLPPGKKLPQVWYSEEVAKHLKRIEGNGPKNTKYSLK